MMVVENVSGSSDVSGGEGKEEEDGKEGKEEVFLLHEAACSPITLARTSWLHAGHLVNKA